MSFVKYKKTDSVALVTMNRPERLNALGSELALELKEAFDRFEREQKAKVAIIIGSGRAFSVGADVKEVTQPGKRLDIGLNIILEALRKTTKPIIAAVNGLALGAGCILMLECDLRIAVPGATFGMPEIKLAIPSRLEGFVAQNIPLCAVMELLLLGDAIKAQRAYDIGLINKIVPDNQLLPQAMKMAERLAQLSPRVVSLVRQAQKNIIETREKELKAGQTIQLNVAEIFASEDFKEATNAFLEKRKPEFKE